MNLVWKVVHSPRVVIACGMAFSLVLVTVIPGEVFFNGDAGLKALMTRQWAGGVSAVDLRLESPEWAGRAWDEGLYPFEPPFVYRRGPARVIAFPLVFPILSAPFYRFAGFRGLYIIPTVCLWLIWYMVDATNRCRGATPPRRAWMLVVLVFASPLTLYGAMFWEHTFAVALACAGVYVLVARQRVGAVRAAGAGLLLGASAWVRPEMLALIVVGLSALTSWRRWSPVLIPATFGAGVFVPVAGFMAVNWAVSGHPFGFHGMQVVHGVSAVQHITTALKLIVKLPVLFIAFFPPVLAMAAARWRARHRTSGRTMLITALHIAVGLGVLVNIIPNDGGKQWGPRYLLVLIPLLVMWEGGFAPRGGGSGPAPRKERALTAGCVAAGILLNTVVGGFRLVDDYRSRVYPALRELEDNPDRVIAVSHQFVAQELQALMPSRVMFRTASIDDFMLLARALDSEGVPHFTYVCLANRVMPGEMEVTTARGNRRIASASPTQRGWFLIYHANLVD